MKRFRNQELVRFRTVSVGRVDEIHSELNRAPQNLFCILAIGRPTPNPRSRQAHRAKPKSIHRNIAAQLERRFGSICSRHKFR